MVMLLWLQVGFAMVLLSAAIKGVPTETLEAARLDGAGEGAIFFRIVVPQIRTTLITVFITVLIGVLKAFDIVYVMTNGNFNTNVIARRVLQPAVHQRQRRLRRGHRGHAADRDDPGPDLPGPSVPCRGGRPMSGTPGGHRRPRSRLPKQPVVSRPGAAKRRRRPDRQGAAAGSRLVLVLVCLVWVDPDHRPARSRRSATRTTPTTSGWWTVFTTPANFTRLTLENYTEVFTEANMGEAFVNSLAITLPATIIPILIAAFAAYAFTFMQFPGRDLLFIMIVGLLVVPNQVALVPLLKIYGTLGLNGTFLAVWLAHIGFGMPLAVYIIRNYMATLPKEVIESAKIDGASHFQTFWRLILPMSTPVLASFAIFQFLWVWNDLLDRAGLLGPGDNAAADRRAGRLLGQQGQGWQLITAGGFFTMIVPIIVFLSLQRYFVRGMTAGAVKG